MGGPGSARRQLSRRSPSLVELRGFCEGAQRWMAAKAHAVRTSVSHFTPTRLAGMRRRDVGAVQRGEEGRASSRSSVWCSLGVSMGLVRKSFMPAAKASSRSETSAAAVSATMGNCSAE